MMTRRSHHGLFRSCYCHDDCAVHEQTKESQVLNAVRRAPTRAKQLDLLLQWRAESRRQIEDNDAAEQRRANRDLELKVSR